MTSNRSVDFFRHPFDHQIEASDYRLNPFEQWSRADRFGPSATQGAAP